MTEPIGLQTKTASGAAKRADEGGIGETIKVILQALLIAVVVRTILFQPFNIPSGSLIPTLSRTSSALAPFGNLLTMRSLEFDEGQRRLLIDADLADPAAASSIVEVLRKAGLTARFEGTKLIVRAGGKA